jgi:hypothetical protein
MATAARLARRLQFCLLVVTVVSVGGAITAGASVGADTQPPTAPHLLAIHGLGGCEIDLRIGLSKDNVTPQAQIRYQVLSNGKLPAGDVFLADTRGSQPGFGNLDAYAVSEQGAQAFTVRAVDQAGNLSAPSNAISRTVGVCR